MGGGVRLGDDAAAEAEAGVVEDGRLAAGWATDGLGKSDFGAVELGGDEFSAVAETHEDGLG